MDAEHETSMKDARFQHGDWVFEGFSVEDMRHVWWARDDDICCTAETPFVWPTPEQAEQEWKEKERLVCEIAEKLNPGIDLWLHEKGLLDWTDTEDGTLFFQFRTKENDIGPWLLLDPKKCVNPSEKPS